MAIENSDERGSKIAKIVFSIAIFASRATNGNKKYLRFRLPPTRCEQCRLLLRCIEINQTAQCLIGTCDFLPAKQAYLNGLL